MDTAILKDDIMANWHKIDNIEYKSFEHEFNLVLKSLRLGKSNIKFSLYWIPNSKKWNFILNFTSIHFFIPIINEAMNSEIQYRIYKLLIKYNLVNQRYYDCKMTYENYGKINRLNIHNINIDILKDSKEYREYFEQLDNLNKKAS